MLTQDFLGKLRVIDYWDIQELIVQSPVFRHRSETVMGRTVEEVYIESPGQNGIVMFDYFYTDVLEKWKDSIIGIDISRREVFVLMASSSWVWFLIKVKVEMLLVLKKTKNRLLWTLVIWKLADHIPGTYVGWADIKLVKDIKKLFAR